MGNVISLLKQSRFNDEAISIWLVEELIIAYSEDDDVLAQTHSPKQLIDLEMSIAHDLTQLRLIDSGIVL